MNFISSSGKVKPISETVCFRFDHDLKLMLFDEARKQGLNVNTLVSRILSTYLRWWRYADELGLISFSKNVLRELFSSINSDAAETVGERVGSITDPEEVVFLFNKVNPETVRRYIELRGSQLSAYRHWEENGEHHYMLLNDLGSNFTLFVKGFFESLLKSTLGKTVEFSGLTPNSVMFSLNG